MTSETDAFHNLQVEADSLPDYRHVELNPVARSFLPYSLITTAGFWLFLALVLLAVQWVPYVNIGMGLWPPAAVLLATVWFCLITWLGVRRRAWALREHDLIYQSGVIWRKTVIVPFVRIQHVESSSGPLERLFGLMRVKCFTAGGMMADLTVEGLDTDAANRVRQYLLEQIRDDRVADGESGSGSASESGNESAGELGSRAEADEVDRGPG